MALFFAAVLFAFSRLATSEIYTLDDTNGLGRRFDGIGAISSGGTSRLLIDYSPKKQSEILDFLFKPYFGASLQILKVEIGGDAQSGVGTEMSHMRNKRDVNFRRGYEWKLMTEAKKRNPNIKLYGLPWAFPGWLSGGEQNPYKNINFTARYVANWIEGARNLHNLTIDFIGIWNERPYNREYIKTLRKELNTRGFSKTKIVAADDSWQIAGDILSEPEVAEAVDIIGCHYPGSTSTIQAIETNKTLWASEDYRTVSDEVGSGCWARLINENYVDGYLTSSIAWSLLTAYYKGMPFFGSSLITASQPWSQYYEVEDVLWTTAHTTQFTSPGWYYLRHDSGVGRLVRGGTYVTLKSPFSNDFTLVIETMTRNHSVCGDSISAPFFVERQNATFQLNGSLAEKIRSGATNLTFFSTRFDSDKESIFQRRDDIKVINGKFTLELDIDSIYTISTTSGQEKGNYEQNSTSSSFPIPYSDDFDYQREYPRYFSDQSGVFNLVEVNGTTVLQQVITESPINWASDSIGPVTIIGEHDRSSYQVIVNVRVPLLHQNLFVGVGVSTAGASISQATGVFYWLFYEEDGVDYKVTWDIKGKHEVIPDVTIKNKKLSYAEWATLKVAVSNNSVYACLDYGMAFMIYQFPTKLSGWVALGTGSYNYAYFDDFQINEYPYAELKVGEPC